MNTHGGKTGRAMLKYPLYKKNAQRPKRSVYPGSEQCRLTDTNQIYTSMRSNLTFWIIVIAVSIYLGIYVW